jgi:hypothetical protein
MTPAAIIALVRDAVILALLCAIAYILISYGKDTVKISDFKDLQKQLQVNAETMARWQKESTDADTRRNAQLAQVAGTIAAQRAPVFVRGPSCPKSVPGDPKQAGDPAGGSAGVDPGRGVDYRPIINAFELKYSTALIDCYAALDKWPQ